jgi:BirA family biotin operon repressor/biotin-[acetyl-CoA-carboxylase] ligase
MTKNIPPVIHLDEVTSTNDFAQELLRDHEVTDGTCISASYQTAGKGQRGNKWLAAKEVNLTFSIIFLPPSLPVNRHFMLNIVFSLGLRDYFAEKGLSGINVKWPNDILVNGKKIAGILIENSIRGEFINSIVAGFGINVNEEQFEEDYSLLPTSMHLETGIKFNLKEELSGLLSHLHRRFRELNTYNDKELLEEYKTVLFRLHESSVFRTGGDEWQGRIENVTTEGMLEVSKNNGPVKQYSFSEIKFVE